MTQEVVGGEQASLPATIVVGDSPLPTWCDAQAIAPMSAQLMAITTFDDHACYHPALIDAALAAEQNPRFRDTIFKGGCGIKVRDIPGWNAPAATLIHARALLLAHHTVSRRPVYADATWASIYRAGDYCMPHSHLRSNLSIVYMLDAGDEDPQDTLAGRLCFADPRIDACCPHEPGRVTQHVLPDDERRHHADLRQRLPAQRQSLPRRKAADHDVVEYHPREIAGSGRRGMEDVTRRDWATNVLISLVHCSRTA